MSSKAWPEWDTARGAVEAQAPLSLECSAVGLGGYPERTTTMIALSLALFIVQTVAVLASASRWHLPPDQCQITLNSYRFDLCPLFGERHHSGQINLVLHYQSPPTTTTIVYNISLNGPLQRSDAFPDDEQVSTTAANCGPIYSSFIYSVCRRGLGLLDK